MVGCKVNNRMVPIDHIVSTGEIIEVILGPADKGPSRDWLKIVRTSEAKSKIRNWFKKMRREENIQQGRDALARELRREMIFIPDDELDDFIGSCCRRLRQNNAEELYAAIGYGGITIANCLPKLKEEWQKLKAEEGKTEQLAKVDLSKSMPPTALWWKGSTTPPSSSPSAARRCRHCAVHLAQAPRLSGFKCSLSVGF